MPFQDKDFMTPLRKFLENPPFLQSWERLEINYLQIDPQAPAGDGNAMALAGMPRPERYEYVAGEIILRERMNLVLIIQRFTNDESLRKDIGNFIINYIRWLQYEQEQRGTSRQNPLLPMFSQTRNEEIAASGGMGMGQVTIGTQSVDEFQIQIHLMFESIFESEDF